MFANNLTRLINQPFSHSAPHDCSSQRYVLLLQAMLVLFFHLHLCLPSFLLDFFVQFLYIKYQYRQLIFRYILLTVLLRK
jgi:hypothetical protein